MSPMVGGYTSQDSASFELDQRILDQMGALDFFTKESIVSISTQLVNGVNTKITYTTNGAESCYIVYCPFNKRLLLFLIIIVTIIIFFLNSYYFIINYCNIFK